MGRYATVGGVSGVAFLALGLGLPVLMEGLPPAVAYALTALGAILLLTAFVWSALNYGTRSSPAPSLAQSTTGSGSHNFSNVGTVHLNHHAAPEKFKGEGVVCAIPPSMGGNMTLDLAGVATLRMRPPWNETSVNMELDVVPMRHGDREAPGIQVQDLTLTLGKHQRFTFDIETNKRHTISAGGKVFTVTLREVDASPMVQIAKALKYRFSVVEL